MSSILQTLYLQLQGLQVHLLQWQALVLACVTIKTPEARLEANNVINMNFFIYFLLYENDFTFLSCTLKSG